MDSQESLNSMDMIDNKYKMSVIVTTYNQPLGSILITLRSIICQSLDSFEIIVTDDCSRVNYEVEIREFFSTHNFEDYTIIINEVNLGTVKNNLGAIRIAKGKYIKSIGPGDLIYSSDTLSDMYSFCVQNDVNLAFGKIMTYSKMEDHLSINFYNAPKSIELYKVDNSNKTRLYKQLVESDWLPGGSLFFERDFLEEYLSILSEEYKVKYIEDLVSILVTSEEDVLYYDGFVIWYEHGVGISNNGASESNKQMYTDLENFYSTFLVKHPSDRIAKKAYKRFKKKQFIVFHTPIRKLLRPFYNALVMNRPINSEEVLHQELEFLKRCLSSETS